MSSILVVVKLAEDFVQAIYTVMQQDFRYYQCAALQKLWQSDKELVNSMTNIVSMVKIQESVS